MHFLDIKTDYAFKRVFGGKESKHILKSFLNSVLDLENQIVSVQIEDPCNIPEIRGMKDTAVAVKATLDDNRSVIIVMQVIYRDCIENRILYNAAKNFATQLDKVHSYDLVNPVIVLTIVNFDMFKSGKVKSLFQLLEKESLTAHSDDIELLFIELPNFTKVKLEDCNSIEDKWLFFINNAHELSVVPQKIDNNLKHAFDMANRANLTEEEKELQEKRDTFHFMLNSSIVKAKREGIEEGIKLGIERRIVQEREEQERLRVTENIETAKKMIREGLNVELISKFTTLTVDQIKVIES